MFSPYTTSDPLISCILKRSRSLFQDDVEKHEVDIGEAIRGSSILVIGAAGAIGSSFVVKLVERFEPKCLHLVDLSENALVEVIRDLRSKGARIGEDFRTFSIDFRSWEFEAFLNANPHYDYVVNFSALKHVRSERDPFTLARMIDTNAMAVQRLLDNMSKSKHGRFFSVSSDKSVHPANLMGATKGLMERIMWEKSDDVPTTTARFANVAFSAGSLLEGFCQRFQKRQPIAAPSDVRRYFISHEEAGHLCLLAAFTGNTREAFIPRFCGGEKNAMTFSEIAVTFLEVHGYKPLLCASDEEARAHAVDLQDPACLSWPCFFSESDTPGEKDIEEFCSDQDDIDDSRFSEVRIVKIPPFENRKEFSADLLQLASKLRSPHQDELANLLQKLVPDLDHVAGTKNLDHKM